MTSKLFDGKKYISIICLISYTIPKINRKKNRFYRIEKSIICNNVSLRSVDNIYSMHFINEQVYLDIVSKKYNLPASVLSHQEQQNVINIFKYMGKKCIRVYFKMKR